MGFDLLPPIDVVKRGDFGGVRPEFLHKAECSVCPLNHTTSCKNPNMKPDGASAPSVYILGASPTDAADRSNRPWAGPTYNLLIRNIPTAWERKIRWNNVVRTNTPNEREPSQVELECCRPSIIRDIEKTKPRAIFGFGPTPLFWALSQTGIGKWRGRRVPVRIGEHACWFYPMLHPADLLENQDKYGKSDNEFAFELDLKHAFAEIQSLPDPVVHTREDAERGVEWVTGKHDGDVDRVLSFIKKMHAEKYVGIDYETNCKRPFKKNARILTASLTGSRGTLAFPFWHRQAGWRPKQLIAIFNEFKKFLIEAPCRKVSHQLAFELEWSAMTFGKEVVRASKWDDTVSQAYVLDDRVKMSKPDALSLEFLCIQYFGINLKELSPLDKTKLDDEPLEEVLRYNGMDSKYHRALFFPQLQRIKDEGLFDVYQHHLARCPTTVLTQIKGVPVDKKAINRFDKKYLERIGQASDKIAALPAAIKFRQEHGYSYNPTAPQDGVLMLKMVGVQSANADEAAFARVKKNPIGPETINYRKLSKVHSTYIDPMFDPEIVYPDGLMHPIIATNQTRTSRTASDSPNIQNWIKRQGEFNEIREMVAARLGYKLYAFDYAGIQGRNVAMESKDKVLVDAFRNQYDIHTDWMECIARHCPSWVKEGAKALATDKSLKKNYRQLAKNQFVFPSFFGASGKTVAAGLGIDERKGYDVQNEFWAKFHGVKSWQDGLRSKYQKLGYVTGLSGYRRRAPVKQTEIINTPIQADEAIIVCDAWNRCSEMDEDALQPIMMVHDDLTFELPINRADEYAEIIIKEMVSVPFAWANIVPIEIEMSIGDNWADMKDVAKYESTPNGGYKELK
jgi:uracil-DNA glycosylase family 4